MLHLAKIIQIHKYDEFYRKKETVKKGDDILWLEQDTWSAQENEYFGVDSVNGYEYGYALLKNGRRVAFYAIKTRRLN